MSSTSPSSDQRVFYRDIKPYDAPTSLDELHGPRDGLLTLPRWVYWGPNPVIDLASTSDVIKAYQAVMQEGQLSDQVEILNRELLTEIWPELMMPPRVRALWVGRFPELEAAE